MSTPPYEKWPWYPQKLEHDDPPCEVIFIPEGKYIPKTVFTSGETLPFAKSDAR
jgi:hypothetical protein